MKSVVLTFAVVCLLVASAAAGLKGGVDVSLTTALSTDTVQCVENRYMNVRVTTSTGDFLQAGLDTLLHAQSSNMPQIDCLIDICPKKQVDALKTITDILGKLKSSNNLLDKVQYVFMNALADNDEDCWYTSGGADDALLNIAALQIGMSVIRGQGKYLGVKTNEQNWTLLTNDWQGISAGGWQLWWASEGPATFDDFVWFGGWTNQPALRQYQTTVSKCGTQVNLNVGRDDFLCSMEGEHCDSAANCCQDQFQWCAAGHHCKGV